MTFEIPEFGMNNTDEMYLPPIYGIRSSRSFTQPQFEDHNDENDHDHLTVDNQDDQDTIQPNEDELPQQMFDENANVHNKKELKQVQNVVFDTHQDNLDHLVVDHDNSEANINAFVDDERQNIKKA